MQNCPFALAFIWTARTERDGLLLANNESNPYVRSILLIIDQRSSLLLGPARPGGERLAARPHFLRFHLSIDTCTLINISNAKMELLWFTSRRFQNHPPVQDGIRRFLSQTLVRLPSLRSAYRAERITDRPKPLQDIKEDGVTFCPDTSFKWLGGQCGRTWPVQVRTLFTPCPTDSVA